MKHRFAVASFLFAGLFSAQMLPGATQGGVQGRVLVNLQGIEGIPLTLVNVATGQSFSVRTARDGSYSLSLPSGSYVVSSPGVRGLSIGKAPLLIQVAAGRFASANVEMARALVQDATGPTTVFHNPIGCVASNQFPVFDIAFRPAGSVVSARLYFKSNLSEEWFYTEFQALTGNFPKYKWTMAPDPANPSATTEGDDIRRRWVDFNEPEPIDPGVPPTHRAFLPKIQEGSGITEVTYYIQLTLADFTETRIREIPTRVLPKGQACKSGAFAAPGGAPLNGLTVLTSGGLAGAPAGMASIGLSLATEVAVAGAGLVPLVVAEGAASGGENPTPTPTPTPGATPGPTPTPTPAPTPTPTPTPTPPPTAPSPTPTPTPTPVAPAPTPTPTPSPSPSPSPGFCQLQVSVNPPGAVDNPCRADVLIGSSTTSVTTSQVFVLPSCSTSVTVKGVVVDPASFIGGSPGLTWSGACSGDALTPCTPPPAFFNSVTLQCGCSAFAPLQGFTIDCFPLAVQRRK
jgi:cell division septation protein DedD